MRAGVVPRHAHDLNGFTFPERRDDLRSQALRLEWKTDFAFQVVIPAQGLLFRSGIDDSFVVNSVFADRVFSGFLHRFGPRTRRTEVRPICGRRAISDLLTPAIEFSDLGHSGGHAALIMLRPAPVSGDNSTASSPPGWLPVPWHAAGARSGSRRSSRRPTGTCGSGS